jgi:DNA-binding Xre family transcriptional regulator
MVFSLYMRRIIMISYEPFYETMLKKNITEYALIFKHGVPANTLHRMKHGEAITTKTLDMLCDILDCEVSDIVKHIKAEEV